MLKNVEFTRNWRCFKQGEKYEFHSGINLIVGDQGCGKSSLIEIILKGNKNNDFAHVDANRIIYYAFDFEKDNPRKNEFARESLPKFRMGLASRFHSHGETVMAILDKIKTQKDCLFIMDEPDMALSIRSIKKLIETLFIAVDNGCQIVSSAHNPILIESIENVLSLEHKKWMKSKDFILSHLS